MRDWVVVMRSFIFTIALRVEYRRQRGLTREVRPTDRIGGLLQGDSS